MTVNLPLCQLAPPLEHFAFVYMFVCFLRNLFNCNVLMAKRSEGELSKVLFWGSFLSSALVPFTLDPYLHPFSFYDILMFLEQFLSQIFDWPGFIQNQLKTEILADFSIFVSPPKSKPLSIHHRHKSFSYSPPPTWTTSKSFKMSFLPVLPTVTADFCSFTV